MDIPCTHTYTHNHHISSDSEFDKFSLHTHALKYTHAKAGQEGAVVAGWRAEMEENGRSRT